MRAPHTLCLTLLLLSSSSVAHAVCRDGEDPVPIPVNEAKDCGKDGMRCWYWEPLNYDPNVKYPLVFFLHGAGGAGTDASLDFLTSWSCQLEALMETQARMNFPAFIVAPRTVNSDNDYGERPDSAAWVVWDWANRNSYDITTQPLSSSTTKAMEMLQSLQAQYSNIDPTRIYVTGVSMGGYGSWEFASRYPNIFAAAAPSDGGGSPQAAPLLRNMAVWATHNADDPVPYDSDKEVFAAVARAGGRPYFTEGVRGGHEGGMRRHAQMNYVPWLFAQRLGVPTRQVDYLKFSPEGGQLAAGPVMITLTAEGADEIRYTTDGSIPSVVGQKTGTLYNGPFMLETSAILIAAAHSGSGDGEITMFHAEPYKLGDIPLPDGAELVPFEPPPATGGAPNSGSGGAPNNSGGSGGALNGTGGVSPMGGANNASGGGSSVPSTGGAGNMAPGSGGASNPGSASGGNSTAVTGGSSNAPPSRQGSSSSGCSVSTQAPVSEPLGFGLLLGLAAAGFSRSRRGSRRAH